ncbi:MAG: protein translocase subunit SecF [Clostridia bacterium]|nr:protein translocase subunit SecF [Clostridia bacterium]
MREFNIDFNKTLKPVAIVYAIIFVIGIVLAMPFAFGVDLDINFSGGTKISYAYTGDLADKDIKAVIDEILDAKYSLTKSTALAGDTKTFEIALVGKDALSAEGQEDLTKALTEKFKDNKIAIYNSNSVSPTIAGTFFLKSLVAVVITAIFVVIYVGIRFRKIGGISAALTALVALVLDVLITFFVCVIFRLQIDSNYIAVVLTMLGYSLNDTIVIYDRIRENERLNPSMEIGELVNISVNKVLIRNIVTTVTTFLAVMTIVVVAELFGLTTLRTFAIPMAFGLVSGAISSVFISGPLWVIWKRYKAKKKAKR